MNRKKSPLLLESVKEKFLLTGVVLHTCDGGLCLVSERTEVFGAPIVLYDQADLRRAQDKAWWVDLTSLESCKKAFCDCQNDILEIRSLEEDINFYVFGILLPQRITFR